MKAGAEEFLRWIRSHWTMDVSFREDDFQGCTDNLAENFSLLQRPALMLLKQENSFKKSIPQKSSRARWNNDYLTKILGA